MGKPFVIEQLEKIRADFDGKVAALDLQLGDGSIKMSDLAPLLSPVLTGVPKAPTAPVGSNDTTIASTAFVKSQNYLTGNQNISLTGDATGSGTTAIAITLANSGVVAGKYPKVTVDSKGRVTLGESLIASDIPGLDWSKIISGKPTTLGGYGINDAVNVSDVVTVATANKILKLDANAKLPASITGNADGNAATATKLQTSRAIGLSGDASGSVNFDGSGNVSIPVTLANSGVGAGTYPKVTVDSKGRVTAGMSLIASDIPNLDWSKITSGTNTASVTFKDVNAVDSLSVGNIALEYNAGTKSLDFNVIV